jgi:diadenosine tetraphosphate (Ap4A) HIT family hydrolase
MTDPASAEAHRGGDDPSHRGDTPHHGAATLHAVAPKETPAERDWRADRVGSALRSENPTVLRRLPGGFAVMGDVQFLPGYSVLITDAPGADRLTDLPRPHRLAFLDSMELLGQAVQTVCGRRDPQFRRVNLEIQGNHDAFLHAHVWPRYEWEGPDHVWRPVALHPIERWRAPEPETVLGPQHNALRSALVAELDLLSGGDPG